MLSCFQPKFARLALISAILVLIGALCPLTAQAQFTDPLQNIGVRPELLKDVAIDQKLDATIPLDLMFRDETGRTVALGQYFGSKPVILTLVYYNCPMLCTQVLNGLERSLKLISPSIGTDFNVVTVSIDPSDQPSLAAAKHAMYAGLYGRSGAAEGWHFLVGNEPQIKQLADAVGFHYAYDSQSKQFAHAAGIMLLTPEGKLSRYFYGVTYPQRDLRLGLDEASQGKIGSPVDQILLYCYHYDAHTGKYGLLISHVLQLSAGVTVVILAIFVMVLFRGEHYALPTKAKSA